MSCSLFEIDLNIDMEHEDENVVKSSDGGYSTEHEQHKQQRKSKYRSKKSWAPEEDELLRKFVQEYGTINWTQVAEGLPLRTGKQCRERYHNHLQSNIRKGQWSIEEDRLIVELQAKYGNQWAKITKFLPGRTDNSVKNRWHAAMRSYNRTSAMGINPRERENIKPKGRKHPLVPFLPIAASSSINLPSPRFDSPSIPIAANMTTLKNSQSIEEITKQCIGSTVVDAVSTLIKAVSPRLDFMWSSHEHTHEHEPNSNRSDYGSTTATDNKIDLDKYLSPRIFEIFMGFPSVGEKFSNASSAMNTQMNTAREADIAIYKALSSAASKNEINLPFDDNNETWNFGELLGLYDDDFDPNDFENNNHETWNVFGIEQKPKKTFMDLSPREITPRSPRHDLQVKKHRICNHVALSSIGQSIKFLM